MDLQNQLFASVASSLTGGLVYDLSTALTAMFAIVLILMGLDWLKDCMLNFADDRAEKRHIQQAHINLGKASYYSSGENENDVLASMYKQRARRHINSASRYDD